MLQAPPALYSQRQRYSCSETLLDVTISEVSTVGPKAQRKEPMRPKKVPSSPSCTDPVHPTGPWYGCLFLSTVKCLVFYLKLPPTFWVKQSQKDVSAAEVMMACQKNGPMAPCKHCCYKESGSFRYSGTEVRKPLCIDCKHVSSHS